MPEYEPRAGREWGYRVPVHGSLLSTLGGAEQIVAIQNNRRPYPCPELGVAWVSRDDLTPSATRVPAADLVSDAESHPSSTYTLYLYGVESDD